MTTDKLPTAARRDILRAGMGAALLLAGSGRLLRPAAAQEAPTATAADLCLLTPELTEGPYYVEDPLLRQDITEGKPGVPLALQLAVVDVNTCAPLANAAVDIWHCDAHGYYSGVSANNPGPDADPALVAVAAEQLFLRGVQLTNDEGIAAFTTIYPGWYQGRTIHIHLKVHVDGASSGELYEGGHVAHTGQLFFDDAVSDEVFATAEAYAGRPNERRTRNDQDGILGDHLDEPGFLIALAPRLRDRWTPALRERSPSPSTPPPRRSQPASAAALPRRGDAGELPTFSTPTCSMPPRRHFA